MGTISVQDALALAPRRELGIVDMRALLEYEIAERLTVETALYILEHQGEYDGHSLLVTKACEFLATSLTIGHADRVTKAIHDAATAQQFKSLDNWQRILARVPDVRRAIYAAWLATGEEFKLDHHISFSLQQEDLAFLLGLLERQERPSERLVMDIYRIARSTADFERTVEILRSRAASVISTVEASIAASEREMSATREKFAHSRPKRVPLEDALRQSLANRTDPSARLQTLGWLAFSDGGLRPENLDGSFDTLPLEFQQELLDELKRLVTSVQPSVIPSGNTIPGAVLTEGAAIEEALRRFGARSFDEPTVARWFPTLLRLLENDDVIADLSRVFPSIAVTSFRNWIRREMLEDSDGLHAAVRAPVELWKQGLAARSAELLGEVDLPAGARARLVGVLVKHAPEFALPVAREWARGEGTSRQLRSAAIKVLMQLSSSEGVSALQSDAAKRGRQALLDIADAFDFFEQSKIPLGTWAEESRTDLLQLVFEHFPETEEPRRRSGEAHIIDADDHLIQLRDRLVAVTIESNTPHGMTILKALAATAPRLRQWLLFRDAEKRAQEVIDGVPPGEPPSPTSLSRRNSLNRGLPLSKLLSIIRFREYRLARTAADLFRVVREVLSRIRLDIPEDLIVFFPRGWKKHHALEDVLQAYLCRRLNDLMPGRVVDRESWMPLNRRVDLRVRVQYPDLGASSEVPLEIKWSDDSRTPTAANDQLGMNYMRGTTRTHGLYIVGWCGKSAPVSLGAAGLRSAIATSVAEFKGSNPGFDIELVWLEIDPPKGNSGPQSPSSN
ncbi:MAG: hypothetical protein ACOZQL_42125 [Myxococcota bacterium]